LRGRAVQAEPFRFVDVAFPVGRVGRITGARRLSWEFASAL
jgi:hypothetical protein